MAEIPEELLVGVPQHMRHVAKKFWKQVAIGEPDECWLWQGSTNNKGYGQMRFRGRMRGAHTIAYELVKSRLADGDVVLHSCDTPLCCNPAHHSVGSNVDNMQDMVQKGRHASQQKDCCPSGHPYDEANTYVNPLTGWRYCRVCNRERAAERRGDGAA